MEFHEKLQELRKQKGLTQEELAEALYVSRAAVSKWESGRGYPNIDSLKAVAKFFSVTVDELLSGEEVLAVAEEEGKQKENHMRDLVFGLLDISAAMFFFLPFFGQKSDSAAENVSLLSLCGVAPWLKAIYTGTVILLVVWGLLTLALQYCKSTFWRNNKSTVSLLLSAAAVLLLIVSPQPYAAAYLFVLLLIKVMIRKVSPR